MGAHATLYVQFIASVIIHVHRSRQYECNHRRGNDIKFTAPAVKFTIDQNAGRTFAVREIVTSNDRKLTDLIDLVRYKVVPGPTIINNAVSSAD